MAESLAVKYRPLKFEDAVEQTITSRILQRQIETRNFKNAYLFCGSSGCGKTTFARIFAKRINSGEGEPIELDCASYNSVDDVRQIVTDSKVSSTDSEYKIYILDECHAFSTAGWQAFLKGIEEPAPYTIFIFCTTEPTKIPETVLNRLQRFNFGKITLDGIKNRLRHICNSEHFTNFEDSIDLISKMSDGSMRDAITTLEQCSDFSHDLSLNNVKAVIGDLSYETMIKLTNAVMQKNEAVIINLITNMHTSGRDLRAFLNTYLTFVLDLSKFLIFKDISITNIPAYLLTTPDPNLNIKNTVCIGNNLEEAVSMYNTFAENLLELKNVIRYDSSYCTTIIVYLLKCSRMFN